MVRNYLRAGTVALTPVIFDELAKLTTEQIHAQNTACCTDEKNERKTKCYAHTATGSPWRYNDAYATVTLQPADDSLKQILTSGIYCLHEVARWYQVFPWDTGS